MSANLNVKVYKNNKQLSLENAIDLYALSVINHYVKRHGIDNPVQIPCFSDWLQTKDDTYEIITERKNNV